LLWASTGTGTIGATFLAFSDEIKSGIDSTERTIRVATALTVCINDYRTTLNSRDAISDEKEKDRLLKACHQRCADRTLKVLEKNGGIYIKLGQHLVSFPQASLEPI
jgi:aarF domain-containing kinase